MPGYDGEPPDTISPEFWMGPGAGSMFAAAASLESLAGMLLGLLGGQEAVLAAQQVAWEGPAGIASVLATLPHQTWQIQAITQIFVSAAQLMAYGEGFEALRAATPTPAEVLENQTENMVLVATNILGQNTAPIAVNRTNYGRMWVTAASNKFSHEALGDTTVGALPPLQPPEPTAMPMAGTPATQQVADSTQDALTSAGSPQNAMGSAMPLLSQFMSAPEKLGQLGGGGKGLSSLTSMPMQAMSPLMQTLTSAGKGSPEAGLFGTDALPASWLTATPLGGGPVAANLGGGGFGGLGGLGTQALRGPVSWSTVNATAPGAIPESATPISRIAEARAAATAVPATANSMGSGGAMMGPMAHAARATEAGETEEKKNLAGAPLLAAAALYREPALLPVVTGSGGTEFDTGEEDG